VCVMGVKVVRETEKSVLLHHEKYGDAWFPKSQVLLREGQAIIPRWLLDEAGWTEGWKELGGLTFKEFEKMKLSKRFTPRLEDMPLLLRVKVDKNLLKQSG